MVSCRFSLKPIHSIYQHHGSWIKNPSGFREFSGQADADEQALTGAFQQPAPVPGAGFRSLTIKKWVV